MHQMEKEEKIAEREIAAAVLLGADRLELLGIVLLGKLHSLSYSREDESRADLTGSDICATTGYNPYGLVWLFQDFQNANLGNVPQLLSDHPGNRQRVATLQKHFHANPSVFGKFSSDSKSAKLISVPKNSAEVFLH